MEDTFSKVAGYSTLLKVTLPHGCFSYNLNCTNDTKSRKAPHVSAQALAVPASVTIVKFVIGSTPND